MQLQALTLLCLLAFALSSLAAPLRHANGLAARQVAAAGHHPAVARRAAQPYIRSQLAMQQTANVVDDALFPLATPAPKQRSADLQKRASACTVTATSTAAAATKTVAATSVNSQKTSGSAHGIAGSYYPDWNGDQFPPEQVDYSRFNLIYFAFGIPDENFNVYFTQYDSVYLLQRLVKYAHGNNTEVVLSVGGWSGSQHFSNAVSNAANREKLATNLAKLVSTYNLDGIDLDWEYPGSAGATSDYNSADSANLALLLKLLRTKLGKKKLITMAVSVRPFTGSDGYPLSDVTPQAQYLEHVLIMNYDVWGASSNPGPNAPLSNACSGSQQPSANARAAISSWIAAKMPASKLVLGLPAYSYVSWSGATTLVHKRSEPAQAFKTRSAYWQAGRLEGAARRLAKRQTVAIEYASASESASNSAPLAQEFYPATSATPSTPAFSAATLLASASASAQSFLASPASSGSAQTFMAQASTSASPSAHSFLAQPSVVASSASASASAVSASANVFAPSSAGKVKASSSGDLSAYANSQAAFDQLISAGALYKTSDGKYLGANGFTRQWDKCSNTPYLYDTDRYQVVTYDDPVSIQLKARYARGQKIGGFAFWDMSSDRSYALMDAARAGFGI